MAIVGEPGTAKLLRVIGAEYTSIMVLSTARRHGRGVVRLPDRIDRGQRVAAVQVETDDQARAVFRELDGPGRRFFVDIERKQDLDLLGVARKEVVQASVSTIKPNDITVDALDSLVSHHLGLDLSDVRSAVIGTGNLGFKFALRLAERGAEVTLLGRDRQKADLLCAALNAILPRLSRHAVSSREPEEVQLLISAASADRVVGADWIPRLASRALCIDVGINNFAPDFIAAANEGGHTCVRLDVRSSSDALPAESNPFFTEVAGRATVAGHSVVAGGYLGHRGDIVVDKIKRPHLVVGVANGTGGLLAPEGWESDDEAAVAGVTANLASK